MDTNRLPKQALQYKPKWLQYVQILDKNRLPKQALQYKQKWLQHLQILDTNRLQNKDYNINKSGYNMYRGWAQRD